MGNLREKYMKIPKWLRFFVLRPVWFSIAVTIGFILIPLVIVLLILREVLEAWHDCK